MADEPAANPKTAIGVPQNIACATSYVLTWLSGFFWLIAERRDEVVRTHAAISIIIFVPVQLVLGALFLILTYAVPLTGWVRFVVWGVYAVPALASLGVWGWLISLGWRGRKPEIPHVTKWAKRVVELTTADEELK